MKYIAKGLGKPTLEMTPTYHAEIYLYILRFPKEVEWRTVGFIKPIGTIPHLPSRVPTEIDKMKKGSSEHSRRLNCFI